MTAIEAIVKIREVLLRRPALGYVRGRFWTASEEAVNVCDAVLTAQRKVTTEGPPMLSPISYGANDAGLLRPYVLKELHNMGERYRQYICDGKNLDAEALLFILAKLGVNRLD